MNTNIKLNNSQIFKTITFLSDFNPNIITLSDNNTKMKIEKEFKVDETVVKNEWIFESNKFYAGNNIDLSQILQEQIIESRFFFNFQKNFRGSMIILTGVNESILKINSEVSNFIKGVLNEIYN